jgi:hypothetical protein
LKPAPYIFGLLAASRLCHAEEKISYSREILPVLSDKCFYCHGPDKEHRKEDLRLDIRAEAIKAFAWDPEMPSKSEVLIRIFSNDEDERMPPPDSHRSLSEEQKNLIKKWVEQGAEYETHWAFVAPPKEIPVPAIDSPWAKNPIDLFVLARLEKEKLQPSPEAPPERWLRRVTFNLTGLPPTQPEIDFFLADTSPQAYETAVDRLLASPRFGEQMATPWLDLARYADSFGYQADLDTLAWPYRDWVIKAFNENLPFDQFIIQQLAGDLLPDATREQKLATAFNRIHRKTNEGGAVPEEMRQDGISDRIHTTGTAFMALTFECSRCHDHKYDPISAKDYYSMGAFFNSIDEFGIMSYGNGILPQPALALPTPEQEGKLATLDKAIVDAESALSAHVKSADAGFEGWLASDKTFPEADLVGRFQFDGDANGALLNEIDPKQSANISANKIVEGRSGNGVLTDGDAALSLPDFGIKHADQPFSVSLWLKPAKAYPRAVVFANTTSADAPYSGYELMLENGHVTWSLARENPGNAASLSTTDEIPVGEWTHVTVTNDGSHRASGLRIFLHGLPAETSTVCDTLTRDFKIGRSLGFAARSRDLGLRGGTIDGISFHLRAITPLEALAIQQSTPLAETKADRAHLRDYYSSAIDPEARKLSANLSAARAAYRTEQDKVQEIVTMRESAKPRPAYILTRGDYTSPGEKVERETPDWLPPFPEDLPRNRLGFAKWLTSPDHPLTARVTINRIWQEIFGTGIVETPDNFGLQGKQPSHPELLDWLARDLMNHGWDHKRAIRQMVLSATYRQDSKASPELRERDPANALLGRGPARRQTAEQLRDSALALSGLLSETMGGPPVKPYQPPGSMWKELNNFLPAYQPDKGENLYRRSLYTFWRRTTTPPNMMIFDSTTRDVCAARRQVTNTPLQPLVMLNDPQFVEAARKLGERILIDGGPTDESRAKWAYREVTGRTPTSQQLPLLLDLIREQRELFKTKPADAEALLKVGDTKPDPALDKIESATAAMLAQAVLNLDANITLR